MIFQSIFFMRLRNIVMFYNEKIPPPSRLYVLFDLACRLKHNFGNELFNYPNFLYHPYLTKFGSYNYLNLQC